VNNKAKAYLAVLAVCFWGLSYCESSAQLLTVTPHDLLPEQKIVIDGEAVPQWKVLWNEARKSALQGDFDAALRQYRGLLVLKSNLQEARWELARLLMYLKHWQAAGELLELLIEAEPDSAQYVNALGKVMWETAQYERSVDLFKRVNEKNPADQTALAGLVEGLNKLDRETEALPYLEELVRQEPTNRGIRRYLAFLLYDAGNYEKARDHLTILSRNEDVELEVLYKTAKTYEHLGLETQASAYWERVLAREEENIEAHVFLAKHYEKIGRLDRALSHLKAILASNPDDASSYARLGKMYEKVGEIDKALAYYEKYLSRYPDDQEVLQRIVVINTDQGKRQTQAAVKGYSSGSGQERSENLKQAIGSLEAAGHYQEAIPLYRELIRISPDDQETLAALANDLIAIGKNEGSVSMVEFLSGVVPDNIAIYRSMAELLRRMAREEELLAVLHKIHELDAEDNLATQELAILYLDRGELRLSRKYFNELSGSSCLNIRCLEARASLAEKLDLPAQRLQDYEALLELQPARFEIRLAAVALAARLGLIDTVLFHAGSLQIFPPVNENIEFKILIADAYRESGYLTRAIERYRDILAQTSGQSDPAVIQVRSRSWLGIAGSYEKLGLVYEAEDALRTALAQDEDKVPILEALFQLYLDTGRIAESEIWLQENLFERGAAQHGVNPAQGSLAWKKELLMAEMYAAAGDHELAVDLYREAESLLQKSAGNREAGFRIRLQLAASLLQTGKYAEAERIVLGLKDYPQGELERLVLLEQIYRARDNYGEAANIAEEVRGYAAQDLGRELALARMYGKQKEIVRQAEAAAQAVNLGPESLSAKQLLVEVRLKQRDYPAALELLNLTLKNYPENTWFLSQQAELFAKLGNFQEALGVAEMALADNPDRHDILLLQARIFWEMNQWKKSVALYESVIEPPVEELLEREVKELALTVDTSPARNTWWKKITMSDGTSLSIIAQVLMAPQQAIDFSENGRAVNSISAKYYALYRWQDRFNKELLVRRSVLRREYYHAANKLENVISEFGPNDFLLYDLAGLYSKLERLSDEAAIYHELDKQNTDFPGLPEAIQRNNLKRRPQIFLAYTMQDDDGWDGYKAVRQEMFNGGGRYYQTANREWSFDVSRIDYESTKDGQDIQAWRTLLTYDARLSQALGVTLGGGVEKLESGYDDTVLLYGAVTGKVADEMRAVFSARQDVVADTIASLKRNITKRNYKIEFLFDLFPSILLGGYYDFIDYSDSNWTSNYAVWASYILLPEPTLLEITYNYDFYDSRDGRNPGVPTDDGFGKNDHPYWSPLSYWITRFSFYFKHQLSEDTLARGVPSYYTLEYSVGYDSDDNDLHELKGSLTIEIAKNYLLSASYGYVDVDVYQHKEALLSVMYRF